MIDIEAIRRSPHQFVDMETAGALSDIVMILELEAAERSIENKGGLK